MVDYKTQQVMEQYRREQMQTAQQHQQANALLRDPDYDVPRPRLVALGRTLMQLGQQLQADEPQAQSQPLRPVHER